MATSFQTLAQPTILSTVPASGATGVLPSAPFVVTFSAAMDPSETSALFLNSASVPPILLNTTASWSADFRRLTNTPVPPFPASAMIYWTIGGQDVAGNPIEGDTAGFFMTGSGGTGTAPSIVSTVPSNLATNIVPSASVIFTFSTGMNTNKTSVRFVDSFAPMTPLPVSAVWSADKTKLTNTPVPPFPSGKMIIWNAAGEDESGNTLPPTNGFFSTIEAEPVETNLFRVGLISRGESMEQVETNLFQDAAFEFIGLATHYPDNGVAIVAPPPGRTNTLAGGGGPGTLEFTEIDANPVAFATNFPLGAYRLTLGTFSGASDASITLGDGLLPPAPRLSNWQNPPFVQLGQPWPVQWEFASVGSADYVRLRIENNGSVVFATPLPGTVGALTGSSNTVVVPANTFTNIGLAEVSLTAFTFTGQETNALPGMTLRAARHRTTRFELRIADGSLPPPILLTTNIGSVPVGEPFLNPLFTTNGVRPLTFQVVSGALPPGLVIELAGAISGQATTVGTFDANLRITDLIGRRSTQSLRVVTVPLPPDSSPAHLENPALEIGGNLVFDLVGSAGVERVIERSKNLMSWATLITTNAATNRLHLRLPIDDAVAFFRVRGAGLPFPPANPVTVAPVLNTNVTVSTVLDELGGTIRLTNSAGYVFALNVPPGALDRPEAITMTDVAQIGGLPLDGAMRAAVKLEPEGLPFTLPARLDITAPSDLDAKTIIGFGARPNGAQFALQPAFQTNRTVSLYLWHFSIGGAGHSSAGNAQTQSQNSPDDPMAAMAQQVAAAIQACKADPNCTLDSKSAELIALYIQMADQVIIPKLQKAVADDAALDDALGAWMRWLKDLALLGLYDGNFFGDQQTGELQKRIRRAGSLAAQAIRNGIQKACQRCLEHEVWRIYRMLELTRMASLLGLDYESQFWSCARKCLVFEMQIESEIVSTDGSVIFSTHTKGKAKLKPQTLDGDASSADLVRLMLIFTGSGKWDVTETQHTEPADCSIVTASAAGQFDLPWVKIHLYKKRQVWVPGQGPVTTYVFDPDMTMMMRSGLAVMPKENRTILCPKAPPTSIADIFAPMFHAFHNNEVNIPTGVEALVLGGPVFKITGFVPGGPTDVILSKPYFQTLDVTTENTLLELRHKPE